MSEDIVRKPRHVGQRIARVCAVLCGLLMLPAAIAFFWFLYTRGMADTWTPSMAAAVVFFGCCAGVLYATSSPQPVLPPTSEVDGERESPGKKMPARGGHEIQSD